MNLGDSQRGFTGIELLVALAFIGALGGIAYNVFDKNHSAERDQKRIESVAVTQEALEHYFNEYGGYPSSLEVIDTRFGVQKDIRYTALNEGCTSYHFGVLLEDIDHSVLAQDVDAEAGTSGTNCPDGGASALDFSGADPMYDLKP